MAGFTLHLNSMAQWERIDGVVSFVGEDASGAFGILAGHERFMTTLVFGLARYRCVDGIWQYLALPGGLAYFAAGELTLATRRYVRDTDYTRVSTALAEQLLAEESQLEDLKGHLRHLEENMLKRLLDLARLP